MPQEIEIKLRIDSPDSIRARLKSCGGRRVGLSHETNRIFDTPTGDLFAADCGLRLRVTRSDGQDAPVHASLTYKGPRGAGELKARDEFQTSISDPDACAVILERLGFCEKIVYEKRRETWRLGECEVVVDELPRLGWFLEIEGPDGESIDDARAQLELDDIQIVQETYVEMAARLGRETRGGNRELLFKD